MFRSGFIKWFVKTMLKGMSFVTGLFLEEERQYDK